MHIEATYVELGVLDTMWTGLIMPSAVDKVISSGIRNVSLAFADRDDGRSWKSYMYGCWKELIFFNMGRAIASHY